MGYGYQSVPPIRGRSAGKGQGPPPLYGSVSTFYPDELRLSATGIAVPVQRFEEKPDSEPEVWEEEEGAGDAQQEVPEAEPEAIEINRKMFLSDSDGIPGNGADDMISEASDEEQIALDGDEDLAAAAREEGEQAEEPESSGPPTYYDRYCQLMAEKQQELTRLTGDTPLIRLRNRERQAEKFAKSQDMWSVLRLRQEALGMARLITDTYGQASSHPLLVASCMFRLSQAYFEVKYMTQTAEHAKRALDALPPGSSGFSDTKRTELVQELHILLGESLLRQEAPKPQAALQHLMVAAGGEDANLEEVQDLGLKALISQCHGLMGQTKFKEIMAQRQTRLEAERQVSVITQHLEKLSGNSVERARLQEQLTSSTHRAEDERSKEAPLCQDALSKVEKAQELLMEVVVGVEERLKASMSQEEYDVQKKKNVLLATLNRRGAELLTLESRLREFLGDWKGQFRCFTEILSTQSNYACLAPELVARTHRSKGGVLVRMKRYDEALEEYGYLQKLQAQRFQDDEPKRDLQEAEVQKLMGDVLVAMKDFASAKVKFESAQSLYVHHLGEESDPAWDLTERLQQLQAYINGARMHPSTPSASAEDTEGGDGDEQAEEEAEEPEDEPAAEQEQDEEEEEQDEAKEEQVVDEYNDVSQN